MAYLTNSLFFKFKGNAATGGNDESELHFSESWFHRILSQGRSNAEELLKRNAHLGDGTFLVRPSETFVGGFSLSFHRKGEVIKKLLSQL